MAIVNLLLYRKLEWHDCCFHFIIIFIIIANNKCIIWLNMYGVLIIVLILLMREAENC